MTQKTLILWRHAKAVEASGDMRDHDRPLTQRGHAHATSMAQHMQQAGLEADHVLCSTSARTRQTLAALNPVPATQLDAALYLATAGTLITQIQACDDRAENVMVIGHNPGLHQLALTLAARAENKTDDEALQLKLPTSGVAVLRFDGNWRELAPQHCVLTHYATPESLGVK